MKIKVICLNIWIGGILLDKITEFLKNENADILLLQEVFDGREKSLKPQYQSLTELQKELNYPYSHFAPAFIEDVEGEKVVQGNAILSKFPLLEISVRPYDVPFGVRINDREAFSETPRSLQHVVADINDTQFHLLNTQGIWGEDGRDTPRRIEMAETIIDEVGRNTPLILAGDFNLEPDTETIGMIEQQLNNVFKNELVTSFNLKRKDLEKFPGYATSVVDMMFVSNDVNVVTHNCPQVDISDHLPLVVELEIAPI